MKSEQPLFLDESHSIACELGGLVVNKHYSLSPSNQFLNHIINYRAEVAFFKPGGLHPPPFKKIEPAPA